MWHRAPRFHRANDFTFHHFTSITSNSHQDWQPWVFNSWQLLLLFWYHLVHTLFYHPTKKEKQNARLLSPKGDSRRSKMTEYRLAITTTHQRGRLAIELKTITSELNISSITLMTYSVSRVVTILIWAEIIPGIEASVSPCDSVTVTFIILFLLPKSQNLN